MRAILKKSVDEMVEFDEVCDLIKKIAQMFDYLFSQSINQSFNHCSTRYCGQILGVSTT